VAVAAALAISPTLLPHASAAGDTGRYVSGGTAVVRSGGQPAADNGSVVCDRGDGVGVGGMCLNFGGGDAVKIVDEVAGENVAFQACIDNSGDGVCTSPDNSFPCPDQVFFSHDDGGNFYNPLGPVPTSFLPGCHGGPWKGYVVFLCDGVHQDGVSAHTHEASSGRGEVTTGGEGLGTFCGGWSANQSRKPYTVGSGARYTGGGTAVARENGQPAADDGTVVCNNGDNVGVGGFCTSFGGGDAMSVHDDAAGEDVAFQVCIDNSGDGVCTSPDNSWNCPDQVFFSHDDAGNFYHPLGPIPTGFLPGCGAGAWQGYVVFLCEGTHVNGASAHTHTATTGTGRVTTGGEGNGNFCGGSYSQPSGKRYKLDNRVDPGPLDPTLTLGSGECSIVAANDRTPGGQLGGQDVSNGAINLDVVAKDGNGTPTGEPVTASCELRVNGVSQGTVLGPVSGTGAVSGSSEITFTASQSDVVTLCAHVTTASATTVHCTDTTQTQAVPQPVVDLVTSASDVVGQATDPSSAPDPHQSGAQACTAYSVLAPVVAALGRPDILRIDATGDVFLFDRLVEDCAPYAL
jgi:hypothetical protein